MTFVPTFVGSATASTGTGAAVNSLSVPKPASVADGDVLIMTASVGTIGSPVYTTPSGWTLLTVETTSGMQAGCWYKVVSGDGANYTLAWTGGSSAAVAGISAYRGVDNATPISGHAEHSDGATTTVTGPTSTFTGTNVFTVYTRNTRATSSITGSTSSGATERYDANFFSGGAVSHAIQLYDAVDSPFAGPGSDVGISTSSSATPSESVSRTIELNVGTVTPAPTWMGFSASGFMSSASTVTPTIPDAVLSGDLLLLLVESNTGQAATAPSGWTLAATAQDSGGTNGTRNTVFYKYATGSDSDPTVADTGDHTCAIIHAYRNTDPSSPFAATAGSVAGTATTTVSAPGVTTTDTKQMVVTVMTTDQSGIQPPDSGNITSASLQGVTRRSSNRGIVGTTTGGSQGGGITILDGVKLTAGASTGMSGTLQTAMRQALITFAIKGSAPTTLAPAGNATALGVAHSPSVRVSATTDTAHATTAVPQPSTAGTTVQGFPGHAASTGHAYSATVRITVLPATVHGTGTSYAPNSINLQTTGKGSAIGHAYSATVRITVRPETAHATGHAGQKGIYFGAPRQRLIIVEPEVRGKDVAREVRAVAVPTEIRWKGAT